MEAEFTLTTKIKQKGKESGKMVNDIAGQRPLNQLIYQQKEKQVHKILHLPKIKVKRVLSDLMKYKYYRNSNKYKPLYLSLIHI